MIIATLDTNVLISGLLFDGPPRQVLRHAIAGQFSLVLSPPIIAETAAVLQRPKFGFPVEFVELLVHELESIASIVYPTTQHADIVRDPKDNIIVDCAVEGRAQFIVSGDKDLLSLHQIEGIPVVAPKDFFERLNSQ